MSVTCLVKTKAHETWKPIKNDKKHYFSYLLSAWPDLKKTPTELFTSLNDPDQVIARILSEHSCIQKFNKVQEQLDLRDEMYQT